MSEANTKGVEERWTYKGLALAQGGRLAHCWITTDEEEVLFLARRERYAIASTYLVRVIRGDGGKRSISGTPQYLERGKDEPEWVLASLATEASIERARAEKRAKVGGLDSLTIAQARELMARQLPAQKSGTLAAILLALGIR